MSSGRGDSPDERQESCTCDYPEGCRMHNDLDEAILDDERRERVCPNPKCDNGYIITRLGAKIDHDLQTLTGAAIMARCPDCQPCGTCGGVGENEELWPCPDCRPGKEESDE